MLLLLEVMLGSLLKVVMLLLSEVMLDIIHKVVTVLLLGNKQGILV